MLRAVRLEDGRGEEAITVARPSTTSSSGTLRSGRLADPRYFE